MNTLMVQYIEVSLFNLVMIFSLKPTPLAILSLYLDATLCSFFFLKFQENKPIKDAKWTTIVLSIVVCSCAGAKENYREKCVSTFIWQKKTTK